MLSGSLSRSPSSLARSLSLALLLSRSLTLSLSYSWVLLLKLIIVFLAKFIGKHQHDITQHNKIKRRENGCIGNRGPAKIRSLPVARAASYASLSNSVHYSSEFGCQVSPNTHPRVSSVFRRRDALVASRVLWGKWKLASLSTGTEPKSSTHCCGEPYSSTG